MKIVYPNGKSKALTFSYDDGQSFDRRLIEIFNQHGLFGTFHLNSGTIGTRDSENEFVTWEEVGKLYKGHEVACHGVNHPFFGQLPKLELQYELLEDKRKLENAVKYPVRGMSYPFGEFSDAIIQSAESTGIEYSRTVEDTGNFFWPAVFLKWHPTCHHNKAFHNKELVDQFMNPPSYLNLPLFYIWGHSFEFHRENSWNEMEKLCGKLSGQKDV
jgi:peptidoglycan/xylan/chitin deacetylase (PgdA/CDA1 family)